VTATDGKERYVHVSSKPSDAAFNLKVRVKFPRRLGEGKRHRIDGVLNALVTRQFLLDIADAKSLGHPPALRPLCALASLCGWPHYHHLTWKDWRPTEAILRMVTREVLDHRSLDLLGVMFAGLPPNCCPVGAGDSFKGGHGLDVDLGKQLYREAA
jgi:hypothetical protein